MALLFRVQLNVRIAPLLRHHAVIMLLRVSGEIKREVKKHDVNIMCARRANINPVSDLVTHKIPRRTELPIGSQQEHTSCGLRWNNRIPVLPV